MILATKLRSSSTETQIPVIEAAFEDFTTRKDIAILLINQHVGPSLFDSQTIASHLPQVAEKIRPTVDKYQAAFPALLEIPSKDHPYGPCSMYQQLYDATKLCPQIPARIQYSSVSRSYSVNEQLDHAPASPGHFASVL